MSAFILSVALIITVLYIIYNQAQRKYNYWEKKNVPYLKPLPFLGNYGRYILLQQNLGKLIQTLCEKFRGAPYFGAYFGTEPVLIVQSPELLKQVFTKDFYYFHGREITPYDNHEVVTRNLFFSSGDKWKIIRQNLTPLFTTSKMTNMFYLVEKTCHTFEEVLERETKNSNIIEARDLSIRYTMDSICSCAFGMESNTLMDPEDNIFKFIGLEIFRPTNYRGFKIVFRAVWPALFYALRFKCFPDTIVTFFTTLLTGVFKSRNYTPSPRNDFVDLVLTLKKANVISCDSIKNQKTGLNEMVNLEVDDKLLVSQCIMFFAAGFDTSATTMSFTLYELAKNKEAQKRAADEVDEYLIRHGNKLNYNIMTELPFLNACLYENLRKYPVFGNLTREVMDNFTLPDGLSLDKGLRVHIPVYSLHHNPDYFPDPHAYKPERFLSENKNDVKQYTFFPYGEGPRICLGQRFSKMQILASLVTFLKTYRIELAEGMPETVRFESRTFLLSPRNQGLMLKVSKREGWEQRKLVKT